MVQDDRYGSGGGFSEAPIRFVPATRALVAMPPWPAYDKAQQMAALACLETGRVNQWTGDRVTEFEKQFAAYFGMPHAVAVTNGSLAIELALRVYDIGPGDEVIVTPRSFIASSSSVDLVGATPVFCDVDYDSQVITPATIEPHITKKTRAIIPVHLHGRPCDMPGIMALAKRHNLLVIEDCAQSHGAAIDGRKIGSFGDVSAFSFCQDKIMTTGGEGGMVLFKDAAMFRKAWSFKDHGKSWDKMNPRPPLGTEFRWVHDSIGTNWRMLEMQAAIGLVQLGLLPDWTATRTRIAAQLTSALQGFNCVRLPTCPPGYTHAYYRFAFTVVPEQFAPGWSRNRVIEELRSRKITAMGGPCAEIYREQAYASRGGATEHPRRPVAQSLADTSFVLLLHPTMTTEFVDYYVASVEDVFAMAQSHED